jgi:hypothetical protein
VSAEPRHSQTFGCPVYTLANELQQGKWLKAWLAPVRVGINLGISPTHARSVTLVLSLKSGLASPQFHTKHDDLFETVPKKAAGFRMPKSQWQQLSGFIKKGAATGATELTPPNKSGATGASAGQISPHPRKGAPSVTNSGEESQAEGFDSPDDDADPSSEDPYEGEDEPGPHIEREAEPPMAPHGLGKEFELQHRIAFFRYGGCQLWVPDRSRYNVCCWPWLGYWCDDA